MIAATDLVALVGEHLQLRPKGREHVGLCPFHEDSRPSFSVITHKESPFYNCFACGKAGSAIDFMMEFHKMSFPEALKALAERAGIELSGTIEESEEGTRRKDLLEASDAAARWYRRHLLDEKTGELARETLLRRGINEAMSEQFMLGVAPDEWDGLATKVLDLKNHARMGDRPSIPFEAFVKTALLRPRNGGDGHYDTFRNRLIFPIGDELGRPIAFGGRAIKPGDEPKYLNSPENPLFDKSRTLYAFHLAKKAIIDEGHAIVVEGYTDAIACHQAGITNVVATLGTALTRQHARRLERICTRVTLVFDGDTAGQRAADRAVEVFFNSKIDLSICTLPGGADPDGLLKEDDGEQQFHDALAKARDVLDHLVTGFRINYTASVGVSGRQQAIEAMLDRLSGLGFDALDGVRRHLVLDRIGSLTGMKELDLARALASRRRPKPAEPRVSTPAPAAADAPSDNDEAEIGDLVDDHGIGSLQATPNGPTLSVRHREAERRVLSLFLFDPELARVSVDAGEGTMLPAGELCPAIQFLDASHRILAEQLLDAIDAGETPDVGRLLLDAPDDSIGSLAAELYRLGQDILDNSELTPNELLGNLCSELHQIAQIERFNNTPGTDADSGPAEQLKRRMNQLIERGPDKASHARVPRPRRPMRMTATKSKRPRDNR
ncbi:MAG: DNA primase [Phycisphaerales bacterium]|nr:DNA primase [Phycisphaerales bacterium]